MKLKEHFSNIKPSATLAMNQTVLRMWSKGKNVFHLGFGESRFPVHPDLVHELTVHATKQSYLSSLGINELREKISVFFQENYGFNVVDPDSIIIGIGSKSLLHTILSILDGPVLLSVPSWVSYSSIAKLTDHPVYRFYLDDKRSYEVDLDSLFDRADQAQNDTGKPPILILNSPNNPTGRMLSKNEIKEIANGARKRNMVVLSDEIYGLITHGDNSHDSIRTLYPEGTIVFNGISKHLSLGGWRFGFSLVPDNAGQDLVNACDTVISNIWSCVPAPIQHTVMKAFQPDNELTNYINTCTSIHDIRTRYLYDHLTDLNISCPEPQGAFYLYPNLGDKKQILGKINITTDIELAEFLLEKYELATLPGEAFGDNAENLSLRLATSYLDMEDDTKAEAILRAYQKDPIAVNFIRKHHPRTQEAANRFGHFMNDIVSG